MFPLFSRNMFRSFVLFIALLAVAVAFKAPGACRPSRMTMMFSNKAKSAASTGFKVGEGSAVCNSPIFKPLTKHCTSNKLHNLNFLQTGEGSAVSSSSPPFYFVRWCYCLVSLPCLYLKLCFFSSFLRVSLLSFLPCYRTRVPMSLKVFPRPHTKPNWRRMRKPRPRSKQNSRLARNPKLLPSGEFLQP